MLVLDPDFEHDGGHNYVTNQILAGRLRSRVKIVCPVTLPASVAVQGAELCRAFARNSYVLDEPGNAFRQLVSMLRAQHQAAGHHAALRDSFASVIADQLADMNATSRDSIVVHTGSCFLFDALLHALASWPPANWPSLHLRQLRPFTDAGKAAGIHHRLQECRRNTDVYMYAETDAFAAQLVRLGHQACEVEKLEISDIAYPLSASPAEGAFVEVAVLGTVRREKGHGRLEAIGRAYRTLSRHMPLPMLKFNIHTGAIRNGKLFNRMLRGLDRSHILYTLNDQSGDLAGHWRCLADSHIVLVPYESDRYRDRGSGVCIDAVAHGRPLVVPANCTLQEYLRGGNGLAAASVDEFASCIADIAESRTAYAETSLRLAREFRTRQHCHPIFNRLGA